MTEVDYGLAGGVRHVLRSLSPSGCAPDDLYGKAHVGRRALPHERRVRLRAARACRRRATQAIGKTIAEKVPLAVVAAKRSFGLDRRNWPLRDGYRYEQSQTAALAETEDTKEAPRRVPRQSASRCSQGR